MDANTTMKLTQQIRVVNALTNIIDLMASGGELEEFDRNVVSLRRGLQEAHDSFQRLILGQEHPEALAARQVGAETLRKLGYTEEATTKGEDEEIRIPLTPVQSLGRAHAFIPMKTPFTDGEEDTGRMHINSVPLAFARQYAAEMAAMEPPFEDDETISVDASKMVSGQHRLAALAQGMKATEKPDLGEITERFSVADGYPKEADMQHIEPTPFIPIDPADTDPVDFCQNCQHDILYGDVAGLHEAPCTRCGSDGHATCQHQDGKEDI